VPALSATPDSSRALIRVGHKGADAIAPGNTLASFDAALAAGVDMIEFDVLAEQPDGAGELFVVHDHGELRRHGAPTLGEALSHLASPPFAAVRLQVDLKRTGYEETVIEALSGAGVLGRSFISTGEWRSLERVRLLAPDLPIGWTVPAGISAAPLIGAVAGRMSRTALARVAADRIRGGAIDALVPQWQLVTRRLVEAVRGAGGELYAWTVDDGAEIRRLAALGVTGVITNDPRLFALS
jgi:glycerophosphoryl diester phosphodiesterase